jgi:hypothetical protein
MNRYIQMKRSARGGTSGIAGISRRLDNPVAERDSSGAVTRVASTFRDKVLLAALYGHLATQDGLNIA